MRKLLIYIWYIIHFPAPPPHLRAILHVNSGKLPGSQEGVIVFVKDVLF